MLPFILKREKMSTEDRSDEGRHGEAVGPRRKRRWRGPGAGTIEAPQDDQPFEDYAFDRLSSFLCAQLATLLVGYLVLVAGDTWSRHGSGATAALVSAAPAMPMAAAVVVAWAWRSGLRASLAALAFIAALEAGIVLHAMQWSEGPAPVLPAFVLIPLAFSPVLLRGWDFPAAAALAAAGPLAVITFTKPSTTEQFGVALSMFIAISTSLVTNLCALRSQKKNFRLEHKLRAFADIDELTQLPRRRRVFELGRRILQRAERLGQPVSVLYIDADHFKSVNDRFGHDAGDRALRLIAREIQESLRPTDVSGRFGGEEFVALLPGSDQLDAARVAERLRKRIEGMRQLEVTLTISIGVAQHARGELIERAIRRADAALLDAKGSGRNRVVIAPHPAEHDSASVTNAAHSEAALGPPRAVDGSMVPDAVPCPREPVAD
jgi:diguanylate cyclase (GGDEF)-like protein